MSQVELSNSIDEMASIKAVFWDYDNTILSTASAHWAKHAAVLARQGIELDEKFRQRIYENNGNQNWEWMKLELGLTAPREDYLKEIDVEFQKYLLTLEMRPGVSVLLEHIDQLGIPQAIVTNARRHSAEPVLQKRKIIDFMTFAVYNEDYAARKPSPDPYLKALEKMEAILGFSLKPKSWIAIEDDPKGVESASRAGAIAIHRKLNACDPASPYADYSCFHEKEFVEIMSALLAR